MADIENTESIDIDKKYYWLKLQKDFFKRHDIRIIKAMTNGKEYIIFYLTLLLESLSHYGELRFSEAIPYNEEMLSVITDTNIDIVKSAMKVFTELNMIEVLDDSTIYMNEINKMLGCETKWAEKQRKFRAKKIQCPQIVPPMSDKSKSKSIELDKEIDIILTDNKSDKSPYFSDEELNTLFLDFLELRKKLKTVNSDRAIKMLITELNKHDDETKKAMIEKSIRSSWKDVFPLNNGKPQGKQSKDKEPPSYNLQKSLEYSRDIVMGVDNEES